MKASNDILFIKDRHLEGVEICSVTDTTHIFPKHSHEEIYAISLMENGGSYWYGSQKSSSLVKPGNIAVINPGQLHSGEPVQSGRASYKMIYLNKSHFQKECRLPVFENLLNKDNSLPHLFKKLYHSIRTSSDRLEKDIYLTDFIGTMMEKHMSPVLQPEKTGHENKALQVAADFLSADLEKRITLDEVSEVTGLSPYHFLRVFKKHTGITPHIYRTQKRIEKSKELILNGLSLSEVALGSGFTDQSHFTNTFRKYTGATPGQYFQGK